MKFVVVAVLFIAAVAVQGLEEESELDTNFEMENPDADTNLDATEDEAFETAVEENDADPAPGLCNACKLCGVYKKYRNIQNKLATIYCKQCKYCNYGYYVRFFKRLPYKKIVRYVRWITKWGRRRRSWVRRRRRRRRVSRRRRRRRRRRRW